MRFLVPILLLALLALGTLAAVAWERAGLDRYAGLTEQGLGMAQVLRGAALEAVSTLATAEEHLAGRLAAAARRAEAELSGTHMPAGDVIAFVAREERVGRVFLLDLDGRVVAFARHPAALPAEEPNAVLLRERAEVMEREDAEAAVKRLATPPGAVMVEGLQLSPFGTRERFGVAYGRPDGGTLLLRADADELALLRRRFGLAPVLERVAKQAGVLRAALLDAEGHVVLDGSGALPGAAIGLPAGAIPPDGVTRVDGRSLRAVVPLEVAPGPRLAVDIVLSTARADEAVDRSRAAILLGAGLAALAAIGVAGLLGAREVRRRREEARTAARREEERRLADMGALAGLVTHELSNPLNSIRLGLQVLADGAVAAPTKPVLDSLRQEAARMGRTLEAFMGLVRGEGRERRRVGPELLERVRARTEAEAVTRRVRVRVRAAPDAPAVVGDPVVLEQALTNLVRNAVQASPEREAVDLTWSRAEDGSALIRVADRGPGFPADGREGLFHLGASTRAAGHGLGLPLAHRFVKIHGGRMSLLDEPGGGARVEVHLPAAGPATEAGRG